MRHALVRRLTYANVVSTLALALALGGGAVYAAGRVGSHEIKRGAVRSYHVKNRQIRRQDIAGGSINSSKVSNQTLKGRDVRDDSLTGRDVLETTLGAVPIAQDARSVNGVTARVVRSSQPDSFGPAQVLAQGGLTVSMSCDSGLATIDLAGSASGDEGTFVNLSSGTTELFNDGSPETVSTAGLVAGATTVRRLDGTVTRLEFDLRLLSGGFGTDSDCHLHGFLLSGR